eukprot:CAMPEP_0196659230 /NCGR_PEP_ID=MMETSP1086-20130531/33824_1 /TAXON_ID=77921 /ORGANISM="Cyanoptyche  gloeocystis , Strain SAG4.97" /LENGTH=343 /DNA_ID=CAMNT_0041993111 /DNA_START=52 /DNA_END=1079 /DNA_ORIENTATION=+
MAAFVHVSPLSARLPHETHLPAFNSFSKVAPAKPISIPHAALAQTRSFILGFTFAKSLHPGTTSIVVHSFSHEESAHRRTSKIMSSMLTDKVSIEPTQKWEVHSKRVTGIAVSPDGKTVATCSWDKTAKVWQLDDTNLFQQAVLNGHIGFVENCAFSPDGSLLATASRDSTVKVWKTSDWSLVTSLDGHTQWTFGCAFSPDGSLVASGSYDGLVKVWDISKSVVVATLTGHQEGIRSLAFSPTGDALVSASLDKTVKVWSTATWLESKTLDAHSNYVRLCTFSSDGRFLLTGAEDGCLKIWDAASFQLLDSVDGHDPWVNGAFSFNSSTLASPSLGRNSRPLG